MYCYVDLIPSSHGTKLIFAFASCCLLHVATYCCYCCCFCVHVDVRMHHHTAPAASQSQELTPYENMTCSPLGQTLRGKSLVNGTP